MNARYWTVVACACLTMTACGDSGESNNGGGNNGGNNGGQELSAEMVDCSTATIANEVDVADNEFLPASATIQASEVVRWTVSGEVTHTVTSGESGAANAGGLFDSGNVNNSDTYCVKFNNTGTYDYHCIPHAASGMVGTVTVE